MQNYKEVCGYEKMIWFEIKTNEYKKFLNWAKSLGCVWINGDEINVKEKITSFHYSITQQGILAKVPLFSWCSKTGQFDHIKRYMFCEFIKGNLVSPTEYYKTHKILYQKI